MVEKQSDDRRGDPENLVPQFSEMAYALSGIDLPKDREGLRQQAKHNGADEEIMALIEKLPEREYQTMADVIAAAGEVRNEEE